MVDFELVLPAYNESKNLKMLIERAAGVARDMKIGSDQFNLVLVQNGSLDDSEKVLTQLKQSELGPWFRWVTVPKNQGYGYGLAQGLKATSARFVGWSHADMQCDPRNALIAYKKLATSTNTKLFIKGQRTDRNWKDRIVSRIFETIATVVLGGIFHEVNAQPKVFRRDFLAFLKSPPTTFAFDLYGLYIAKREGYAIEAIPVSFPARVHGLSNWSAGFFRRYKTILGMIGYMFRLARTEGRL